MANLAFAAGASALTRSTVPLSYRGLPMDDAGEREFVAEHRPLVRSLAMRIKSQLELTTDVEDLIAYGFGGLLEARERFDPSRGVQFTTFAYYRIRGAILDGVRAMAYLPRRIHVRRKAAEAMDRAAEEAAFSRAASPEERADAVHALDAIDDILGRASAAWVIAALGQAKEDAPPSAEKQLILGEDRERVAAGLEVLPERERTLIEGYYFNDRTLEEMGIEMGISKSWASRLHTRALRLLRDALEDE
jgi:RNA polymerase sigma factor for flagellar operon FliA